MAVGTLVVELIGAFLLAFGILWSYGNIPKATPAVVIGRVKNSNVH
jgi:fluoride ion exporter CrcB/FEX